MNDRRGEKLGWTVGMLGGTAWMFILAPCAFFAGEWRIGGFALAAGFCVVGLVIHLAPWKHPSTRLWKLFLPPVGVMILTASVLAIWVRHGLPPSEWAPGLLVGLLALLLPGIGWRRWEDGNAGEKVTSR
jgi:hypothetical protein